MKLANLTLETKITLEFENVEVKVIVEGFKHGEAYGVLKYSCYFFDFCGTEDLLHGINNNEEFTDDDLDALAIKFDNLEDELKETIGKGL